MKSMLKMLSTALLPLVFVLWTGLVAAQQVEIIELRHKTLDQVLPALLPLVEPGGTLNGMNNQLFLRASPRNRADIKRVLAAIDTPTRRLIIRISQNRESEGKSRGGRSQRPDRAWQYAAQPGRCPRLGHTQSAR